MPLQSSGQISMSNIRTELGSMATNFSLSGAESGTYAAINQNSASRPNGQTPNAMSEWYSYDHLAVAPGGCTCWVFEGYSRGGAEFIYTPCGGSEITVGVAANNSINVCVEDNTSITIIGNGDKFLSLEDCCEGGGGYTLIYLDYSSDDSCPFGKGGFYYIDATSFSGASNIYTDAFGNSPAPDGYYGDPNCCYRSWFGGFLDSPYIC